MKQRPLLALVCCLCSVFCALCFVAMPTRGDDATPTAVRTAAPLVSVHASVDHTKDVTIGDPIRYTVEMSAPLDTELVIPVLSGAVGDFTITNFGELPARKENGRVILSRWYTLTTFATGDHRIPAPKVQYRTAGEGLKDVEGNEVSISVASLLAQDKGTTDIRDIKPPEEVPFDWRPYGIVAATIIGVGLLGAAFFYLLNRPRKQRVLPPRPAHEVALAALNRLRTRRLIEAGKFEEYYVELSAVVRRYLEDGFHLRAPEMTTEEFLAAVAREGRLVAPHRRLLADFLAQADLVKFARHHPSLKDTEAAYDAAQRFIEDTRPKPTGQTEAQHAAA